MATPAEAVSDLQPYPAYKPSGVEWLGGVPPHWEVQRLGRMGTLSKGNGGSKEDEETEGVPCVRYGDLYTTHTRFIRGSRAFVSQTRASDYTPLKHGDVLFAASGETIDEIGKSAVNLMSSPACCGGDIIVFRPNNRTHAPYMGYATDCWSSLAQKATMGRGFTVVHIYATQLKHLAIPVPPLSEQTAIARYLDHADERIRRCIQANEKLVELLEEQRQALFNEAVTGRVDVRTGQPYPEYKPSGVEWLGEVPAHWVVASLRHRYQQRLGKMLDSKRITGEHLLPYLRNVDVQWDKVNVVDLPMMDILPLEIDQYTVQSGDLIVCEGGEVGRCAIWRGESGVLGYQKALHRLRPHRRGQDNPRFMYHTLRHAVASEAFNDGHESTIGHLTGDKLRAHRFPFPPSAEQTAIAHYLDRADERIRRGIQAAQRQIDLLKEYRTRLIADVVTGKLDVREAAAELEGDLEEQESITGPDASAVMGGESARIPNVATQGSDV